MAKVNVQIRQARESDLALVYKTWIDTYAESNFARKVRRALYPVRQRNLINQILARPTTHVLVACVPDDEETLLGWAVLETPNVIHYAFMKKDFRRFGIAEDLCRAAGDAILFSHRTPFGECFIRSFRRSVYDPYAAFFGPPPRTRDL